MARLTLGIGYSCLSPRLGHDRKLIVQHRYYRKERCGNPGRTITRNVSCLPWEYTANEMRKASPCGNIDGYGRHGRDDSRSDLQ